MPRIELECASDGEMAVHLGPLCVPRCGDGLMMPTDHLDAKLQEAAEECDDGNEAAGDGCSPDCRVEAGFVCIGGDTKRADQCREAGIYIDSSLTMSISGSRLPTKGEVKRATRIALSAALGCKERDVEILDIITSNLEDEEEVEDGEMTLEDLALSMGMETTSTTTTMTLALAMANLSAPVQAGDTALEVGSMEGFAVGDVVRIGEASGEHEYHIISSVGSIMLQTALISSYPAGTTVAKAATSVPTPAPPKSKFHSEQTSVEVMFRVKISEPAKLSIDQVSATLNDPDVLVAKLWVAFTDLTTLRDLYIRVVSVGDPVTVGELSLGRPPPPFSLSTFMAEATLILGPLSLYFFTIGVVVPYMYWVVKIRSRDYRLTGRLNDVSPEFKESWNQNVLACMGADSRRTCCSLILCLPARVADTWDSMGQLPYWVGVRKALCCCCCYLFGCFPCGAMMVARYRSEMRDFFGFGDGIQGNVELSDICCYTCCPCCCIVQEASHVDGAMKWLPPPIENPFTDVEGGDGGQGSAEFSKVPLGTPALAFT